MAKALSVAATVLSTSLMLGGTLFAQSVPVPAAYKYVGPGSCAASACHGSVKPMNATRVLQNEYSIWTVQDSHARAYRSLENAVSQRMGRILGIADPPHAQKCLVCHALDAPSSAKARDFDIGEGVSCESCHGPASVWLGPHTLNGASHEQSVHNGMVDLRNLRVRAEQCLSCHLGTKDKQVDHEMIAAGHPDLVFELDSYSAIMPPHWKPATDPSFGVRDWSIGQVTALQESLARTARHARGGQWPEYSDLDCFACHHSLTNPENSWRQERGYPQHEVGAPPFNMAHYAVFRVVARQIDAQDAQQLDAAMDALYKATSKYHAPANEVAVSAEHAQQLAQEFVSKVNGASFDRSSTAHMLARISEESAQLANDDTRSAEQAAMALETLYISYAKQGGESSSVRSAIDGLFKLLQNPSTYNAPQFRAQVQRVYVALKEAGIK